MLPPAVFVCSFVKSPDYNGTTTRVFIIPFPLIDCILCFILQIGDLGTWTRQKWCIPDTPWIQAIGQAELQGTLQIKSLLRLGHSLKKDGDLSLKTRCVCFLKTIKHFPFFIPWTCPFVSDAGNFPCLWPKPPVLDMC